MIDEIPYVRPAPLVHPHPVCMQANALYAMAIAHAVQSGIGAEALYGQILDWAREMKVERPLLFVIEQAQDSKPGDYLRQQGWVLIAFQNALWQLLHAKTLKNGVVDTVMQGGDTDTNAAICGALLGAVYGLQAIPRQWTACVLSCEPDKSLPYVRQPRPECYWPGDALELAEGLVGSG